MFYNELCYIFIKTSVFTMTFTILRPFWHRAGPAAEQSRAEPSQTGTGRAEPSRAEPSRAEPSQAEPGRAEPGRAEDTALQDTALQDTALQDTNGGPPWDTMRLNRKQSKPIWQPPIYIYVLV